jgi:hypothetical protein
MIARAILALALVLLPASVEARQTLWRFDNLARIGHMAPQVLGHPQVQRTPLGKALVFDGVQDALILPRHPLAGAARFTAEALFRPDGGAFEQRWLHLASDDQPGRPAGKRASCSKSAWSEMPGISIPSSKGQAMPRCWSIQPGCTRWAAGITWRRLSMAPRIAAMSTACWKAKRAWPSPRRGRAAPAWPCAATA